MLATPNTLFTASVVSVPCTLFISFSNASKFKSDDPPVPVPFSSVDDEDDDEEEEDHDDDDDDDSAADDDDDSVLGVVFSPVVLYQTSGSTALIAWLNNIKSTTNRIIICVFFFILFSLIYLYHIYYTKYINKFSIYKIKNRI